MRKAALLNAPVAQAISLMGHTDSLCVADAGLPIPDGVARIDLAVRAGLPAFLDVLSSVTGELFVERMVMAQELVDQQPGFHERILEQLRSVEAAQGNTIALETVSHEDFKARTGACRAVVRTGECTPYANVILYAGVPF